jgi:hypothetical protein
MVDPAYPPLGERPESLDGVRVDIPTYKAFPLGSVHVVGFPAEIGFSSSTGISPLNYSLESWLQQAYGNNLLIAAGLF